VLELRGRAGLTLEPGPIVLAGKRMRGQDLESDRPVQLGVVGAIYDAHAASSELGVDAVLCESGAGHMLIGQRNGGAIRSIIEKAFVTICTGTWVPAAISVGGMTKTRSDVPGTGE